ncbi:hypothetical protein NP233_g4202 [Leucocoprinus birnbaumii]|uniref:Actin-like ATPase domain-containing protein n=1 Tax=Leucocoprinus birnbaumii TaxID=56174 RepID=A0AAD5VXV2_9AGAR|nr:hypothetical protein NP233_g4202 [Leucocoprinus birnbaumii]
MPSKERRRGRPRSAPEPGLLATSKPFGEGRRLQKFNGKEEKLVLSIDIGTTFSAASYCVLQPGRVPNLEMISSWPGQAVADSKVPSVLYYSENGEVMAWGAETIDPDVKAQAHSQQWVRVEWFKLLLRPTHLPPMSFPSLGENSVTSTLPTLPPFLTLHHVYTDFLTCMYRHIRTEFSKTHSSGSELWQRLYPTMEVVFTIPSGWEFRQQYQICAAAVDAQLMGTTWQAEGGSPGSTMDIIQRTRREMRLSEAMSRIRFVSEPEAAMVYAANSGYIDSWLRVGQDVILCDAGGGTIDLTAYTVIRIRPLQLKEKYASKCVVAGAVLVNRRAEKYFQKLLHGTPWGYPHIIQLLMDEFESDTKKRFTSPSRAYGIGKGGSHEFIKNANVRSGRLYIPGEDLKEFFEPPLRAIKNELKDTQQSSGGKTRNVVIVGGLMNSAYAYSHLEEWGRMEDINLVKPDGALAKAVSHGALLWYLTKPVRGYITKVHYGIEASLEVCDVPEEDLVGRKIVKESDGSLVIEGGWSSIASMGQELDPETELVSYYERAAESPTFLVDTSEPPGTPVQICSRSMAPKATGRRKGKKRAAPSPSPRPSDTERLPHNSQQLKAEKLLISIDIGTTCSAASLCLQRPGRPAKKEIVSGWPGQLSENEYKIPSVIFYDLNGEPKSWGAETTDLAIRIRAAKEDWIRVEWFKLLLKPSSCATDMESIPELPDFLTPEQVYTDFLKYMLDHIQQYFSKHRAAGDQLWDKLLSTAETIIAIPNGWELKQQYAIRRAAVSAGFLGMAEHDRGTRKGKRPRTEDRAATHREVTANALERIRFVSESEAAMVYAAESGNIDAWLEARGNDIIVCDVGGGTIDITHPEKVNLTQWNSGKKINQLMDFFERETKKRLKYPMEPEYGVGPGGTDEESTTANVRNGILFIPSNDFETFFQPTLNVIKTEIHKIWRDSHGSAKNVIMVGGFMNSPYAFQQLEIWGREDGINFSKPDGIMAKTVPHGALLWHIANPVKGYIVKFHCGSSLDLRLPHMTEEEIQSIEGRERFDCVDGTQFVKGGWEQLASMGETIEEGWEIIKEITKWVEEGDPDEVLTHEYPIYVCRNEEVPKFTHDNGGQIAPDIEHVCSVKADVRDLFKRIPWETNQETREKYKRLEFYIAIRNGGYNLDAYAYWEHKAGLNYPKAAPKTIESFFQGEKCIGESEIVEPDIRARDPSVPQSR